jgi:hypothetical protein
MYCLTIAIGVPPPVESTSTGSHGRRYCRLPPMFPS